MDLLNLGYYPFNREGDFLQEVVAKINYNFKEIYSELKKNDTNNVIKYINLPLDSESKEILTNYNNDKLLLCLYGILERVGNSFYCCFDSLGQGLVIIIDENYNTRIFTKNSIQYEFQIIKDDENLKITLNNKYFNDLKRHILDFSYPIQAVIQYGNLKLDTCFLGFNKGITEQNIDNPIGFNYFSFNTILYIDNTFYSVNYTSNLNALTYEEYIKSEQSTFIPIGTTLEDVQDILNEFKEEINIILNEALDNKVDKIPGKELSSNDFTDEDKVLVGNVKNKIDKVPGKGLSSNDFTDEYKKILDNLNTLSNLSGTILYLNINLNNVEQPNNIILYNDFIDYYNIYKLYPIVVLNNNFESNQLVDLVNINTNGLNFYTQTSNQAINILVSSNGDTVLTKEELKFGNGVEVVETLEDLNNEELHSPGQPVYVKETDESLYYSSIQNKFKSYTNVVEQKEAPTNTNYIWIDESDKSIPEFENEDLRSIQLAIQEIQNVLEKYKFAFEEAMVSGDFTNSARLKMLNAAEPIKPEGAPDKETKNILVLNNKEINSEYPEWAEDFIPNLAHLSIKMGKYSEMIANKQNFINGELLWCYDTSQLYILSKGQFIWINKGGGSGSGGGLDYDALDKLSTIGFISDNGTNYRVKVNNYGELIVYKKELDTNQPEPTGVTTDPNTGWEYVTNLYLQKLYINSLYCGGLSSNEHSYNLCSHNFIELSNLTNNDISLKGLSIQYCSEGTEWEVLPLWGEIKSQSTFLIRGAQCSVLNANTTRIKINTFDMEWYDSTGNLIKFDNTKAKFLLTWGTDKCTVASPYVKDGTTYKVSKGYIDFVGLNKENAESQDVVDGSENTPYKYLNSNRIFTKYYNMDPVSQATKALNKRNNTNDWYFVQLDKDTIPTVDFYVPKSTKENKNIFFNKTHFNKTKPNYITCTFGIQATAPNATRCFNWISVGYYDEYLMYKLKTSDKWIKVESFKSETGVRKYYNRIRMEATDGTAFTSHKVIIKNLSAGEYEYKVYRNDNYESDIMYFTIKNTSDVNSFKFIHTSDQQGFNWDEYIVWKKSCNYIKENVPDISFTINTGDISQNGNRVNEWLDYYSGREALKNIEEMTTIGNNDLCPANIYNLGDGGDASKINSNNMTFFYTYEIDEDNPPIFNIENKEVYIPSLYSFNYGKVHFICVNSEIPALTETNIYGLSNGGQVYSYIKQWCLNDIEKVTDYTWRIAYCHEMPFTIITQNVIQNFYWNDVENQKIERSGSRMNFNTSEEDKYWFSRFCQDNDIRLILGGHKHTYSCSWPLKETVKNGKVVSMKPTIQVTQSDLQTYFNSSSLYTETSGDLEGQSFPSSWQNDDNYKQHKHLCTFELVDKITAPIYSMLQATGYKHTSNKELPAPNIPWLRYYFPAKIVVNSQTNIKATVNAGQKYPFYTIWEITDNTITGTAKKINYIFNASGKFNINISSSNNPPEAIGGNGEINSGNDLIIINK